MKTYENERRKEKWRLSIRFKLHIMDISKGEKDWVKVNYNKKYFSRVEKNWKPRETKKYCCVRGNFSERWVCCELYYLNSQKIKATFKTSKLKSSKNECMSGALPLFDLFTAEDNREMSSEVC